MGMICFNLMDFSRFYHSLIEMCGMNWHDALELTYALNTANIDTVRSMSGRAIRECSSQAFTRAIQSLGRPYSNLLSFYESMDLLDDNIYKVYLTQSQRAARARLHTLMRDIRYKYRKDYGVDLDDVILACNGAKRCIYMK